MPTTLFYAGADLQRFALVITPQSVPPFLKSIILRFVLVACSFLDEARAKQLQQTQRGQSSGLQSNMSSASDTHAAELPVSDQTGSALIQDRSSGTGQQNSAVSQPAGPSNAEWLPYPMDSSRSNIAASKTPRAKRKGPAQSRQPKHQLQTAANHAASQPGQPMPPSADPAPTAGQLSLIPLSFSVWVWERPHHCLYVS